MPGNPSQSPSQLGGEDNLGEEIGVDWDYAGSDSEGCGEVVNGVEVNLGLVVAFCLSFVAGSVGRRVVVSVCGEGVVAEWRKLGMGVETVGMGTDFSASFPVSFFPVTFSFTFSAHAFTFFNSTPKNQHAPHTHE